MGAILTLVRTICTTLCTLCAEGQYALSALLRSHACARCSSCDAYNDEAFFTHFREQSQLPGYGDLVIQSGQLHKPLRCSRCDCPREAHGTLRRLALTPDLLPNGGVVHATVFARSRIAARVARAARLAGPDVHADEQEPDANGPDVDADAARVTEAKAGRGARGVCEGDQVVVRYRAFAKEDMRHELAASGGGVQGEALTVGQGSLMHAFDSALHGMRVGSVRTLDVRHDAIFDSCDAMRPADRVIFRIELLAFTSN